MGLLNYHPEMYGQDSSWFDSIRATDQSFAGAN
jgi:hypothetical protein